ncbi:glycosyltransferase [Arthrobacter sp. TMT4-20]
MTNDIQPDLSIVFGFRDWGLDRLALSIQSIRASVDEHIAEIIVSDFGSKDPHQVKEKCESLGAVYSRTETPDGKWSRSKALNAGFARSHGKVLVSTDADMIFAPGTLSRISELSSQLANTALLLQCRDLPPWLGCEQIRNSGPDWVELDRLSRLRPRWGMGGMVATSREVFLHQGGYDERMHTYGGEDLDFAERLKRSGTRLVWVDEENVRMFHVWHPSTLSGAKGEKEVAEAVRFNREILAKDKTGTRNVVRWEHKPNDAPILVTVVIATFNRSNLLRDSIASVLLQTVENFELVIIDDGSTDETKVVVDSFTDKRIKYIYQNNRGVAAARNTASDIARGLYTVVHDDDDIMMPQRLEHHFDALTPGSSGSYGAYINFDDSSGSLDLVSTKRFSILTSMVAGGAPGHSTWMILTASIRSFRYDEFCESGSDNNLALRMIRSGLKFDHSGKIMTLRRMHQMQMTNMNGSNQRSTAKMSLRMLQHSASSTQLQSIYDIRNPANSVSVEGSSNYSDLARSYLPDHLVSRSVTLHGLGDIPGKVSSRFGNKLRSWRILDKSGQVVLEDHHANMISLSDLAFLKSEDVSYSLSTRPRESIETQTSQKVEDDLAIAYPFLKNVRGGKVFLILLLVDQEDFSIYSKDVFVLERDGRRVLLKVLGEGEDFSGQDRVSMGALEGTSYLISADPISTSEVLAGFLSKTVGAE